MLSLPKEEQKLAFNCAMPHDYDYTPLEVADPMFTVPWKLGIVQSSGDVADNIPLGPLAEVPVAMPAPETSTDVTFSHMGFKNVP